MPQLAVEEVSRYFGGITALEEVSLHVDEGEIVGLIGPNGAGKTTLFNVIAGVHEPSSGRVLLDDEDVTGLRPYQICRRGLTKSHQIVRPFGNLTIRQNVEVGARFGSRRDRVPEEAVEEALEFVNLADVADRKPGHLSIGALKRLEIARVLATDPDLIMFDEVAGGLDPAETDEIVELIDRIARSGKTIFLIDHVMRALMTVSERVYVLNNGELLAEGTPEEIQDDRAVIEAYLGTSRDGGDDGSGDAGPAAGTAAPAAAAGRAPAGTGGLPDGTEPMLAVQGIDVSYGDVEVLWDVSLDVGAGETVALLGANGAGKTTTLRAIFGLLAPTSGSITFQGEDLTGMPPEQVVRRRIAYVPERRSLFPDMNVVENLSLGAYVNPEEADEHRERVFALFPRLEERRSQLAKTLSGGEQQMLAIGRGLMSDPTLLLLDEASLGLAPVLADEVFAAIAEINEEGTTVLLVEQDLHSALRVADRGYVLRSGEIELSGTARELREDEQVSASYLGA